MSNRYLKLAAFLCILFCTVLAIHQTYFLFSAASRHPFLAGYRISSSIEAGVTIVLGLTAAILLVARQTALRGLAVGIFCLLAVWKYYISGLSMFFYPPFGDGSLRMAFSMWWRLISSGIAIHASQFTTLMTASIFAFYGVYVLRTRTAAA